MVILSDMDGTLLDTEEATFRHYTIECEKRGLVMERSYYLSLLGYNMKVIRADLERKYAGIDVDELIADVHKGMKEEFKQKGVPLKKGAMELAIYCKEHGIRFGVATSSSRSRVTELLTGAGLMQYVDDAVCGDEIVNSKPDPEIFLKLCHKLGANAEDCIVLEDAETGMEASFRGGMKGVCIPDLKQPNENCLHGAPKASSLLEVLEWIKEGKL